MLYGYFFISIPPRFARFYAFSRLIAFFSRLALIFDKLCGTCRSLPRGVDAPTRCHNDTREFNIKSIY